MQKNKYISIFLIVLMIFSNFSLADNVIPNNGNSLSMFGVSNISSGYLSGTKIHKESYHVLPESGNISELSGQVNWSIAEGNIEGLTLLTGGGTYNNEADIILQKDKLRDTSFTLRAISPSHGTYEKNIVINRAKNSEIKIFEINSENSTKELNVLKVGENTFNSNLTMSNDEHTLNQKFSINILDKSFPMENVTTQNNSNIDFSLTNPIAGISLNTGDTVNSFIVNINREELTAQNSSIPINITGTTINGVSFDKTLNISLKVLGTVGEGTDDYKLEIETLNNNSFFLSDGSTTRSYNFDAKVYRNGKLLSSPVVSWSLDGNPDNLSISSSGTLIVGVGHPKEKHRIRAYYSEGGQTVEETFNINILQVDDYAGEVLFDSREKELAVEKPFSGTTSIDLYPRVLVGGSTISTRELAYEISPAQPGIQFVGDTIEIGTDAPVGDYIITSRISNPSGSEDFITNEIKFTIYENGELNPNKDYKINLNLTKNKEYIPLTTQSDNFVDIEASVTANGFSIAEDVSFSIFESGSGMSFSGGNRLIIPNNANEGFYTIMAQLDKDNSILATEMLLLEEKAISSSGWTISSIIKNENEDEIIAPSNGNKHLLIENIISLDSVEQFNQPIEYNIPTPITGVSINNNILTITDETPSATFDLEVYLKNNPSVKITKEITIYAQGVVPDNYSIDISSMSGETEVNIPKQGEAPEIISLLTIVRNNGIMDTDKSYSLELLPSNGGVYIDSEEVIIPSSALPGTYSVKAFLDDDDSIYETLIIKVNDPNIGSNVKQIYIEAPYELAIPRTGEIKTLINYEVRLNGSPIEKEDVIWSLVSEKDGVSINENGVVTITSYATDGYVDIKATLESNSGVKATVSIPVRGIPINPTTPNKVDVEGFSMSSETKKVLLATKNSGNKFILNTSAFDSENNLLIGSEVELKIENNIEGVKIEKTNVVNEYVVYVNDLMDTKSTEITAYSKYNETIKKTYTLELSNSNGLDAYINFNKNEIIRKDNFGVKAVVANTTNKDKNTVLIIVVYKGNEMVDIKYNFKVVAMDKTETLEEEIRIPNNIENVKVKAFLSQGRDYLTANKLLTDPISISVEDEE